MQKMVRELVSLTLLMVMVSANVLAHDHLHPELNQWFHDLHSKGGQWCCDGSEALHLSDVDWATQNYPTSHFKVKIPKDAESYYRALIEGKEVETIWVNVPDDAVIEGQNKDGTTLVWPTYGTIGATVRCFFPGPLA